MKIERDIKIIEAILFASNEPVSEDDLREKITNKNNFNEYLINIQKFYEVRGINLIKTGSKWSFRTSSDLIDELTIFKQQKRKLSRAALETLAIIAYHQPVSRAEIEEIRGVSVSRGTLDLLIEIEWVRLGRRRTTPGRPVTFMVTQKFLDHFGLSSLKDLPGLKELRAAGLLESRPPPGTSLKEEEFSENNGDSDEADFFEDDD